MGWRIGQRRQRAGGDHYRTNGFDGEPPGTDGFDGEPPGTDGFDGEPPGPTGPVDVPASDRQPQFIDFPGWSKTYRWGFEEPIGATASSGLRVKYAIIDNPGEACALTDDAQKLIVYMNRVSQASLDLQCVVEASHPGNESFMPAKAKATLVIRRADVTLTASEPEKPPTGCGWRVRVTASPPDIGYVTVYSDPTGYARPVNAQVEVDWDSSSGHSLVVTVEPEAEGGVSVTFDVGGDGVGYTGRRLTWRATASAATIADCRPPPT